MSEKYPQILRLLDDNVTHRKICIDQKCSPKTIQDAIKSQIPDLENVIMELDNEMITLDNKRITRDNGGITRNNGKYRSISSIDGKLHHEFKLYCVVNKLKMNKEIEKIMKKYLEGK